MTLPVAVAWFAGIAPEPAAGAAALPWPRLRARLTRFPELAAGLDKRAAPGWAPVAWADGAPHRRAAANVGALSALVLDFDKLPPGGLADIEGAAEGLGRAACWHTSWSHADQTPKGRLILPFATPCPVAQWPRVWGAGARWAAAAGLEVDTACRDPGRWYLLPGLPVDAEPARWEAVAAGIVEGEPLSWRWFAAAWPEPPPPPVTLPPRERTRTAAAWADHERRRADALLSGHERGLGGRGPGSRNNAAFMAGLTLGGLAQNGLVDAERWAARLVAAAVIAGLGEREAWAAVRSGMGSGAAQPWVWPEDAPRA